MSDKLFTDLNHLCDVLGVNSHSYCLNVIAREVLKDSVGLHLRPRPSSELAEQIEIEEEYISEDIDPNGNKRAF
jgi:hypothetical protein